MKHSSWLSTQSSKAIRANTLQEAALGGVLTGAQVWTQILEAIALNALLLSKHLICKVYKVYSNNLTKI
jgi:hypothetical protein